MEVGLDLDQAVRFVRLFVDRIKSAAGYWMEE